MSVRIDNDVIHLEGECPVEDAETLVRALESVTPASVDLAQCRQLHGAVVQVLLAFNPRLIGAPEDPFLRDRLTPALKAAAARADGASEVQ